MKKNEKHYLIYFELHVDDRTFYVHGVVDAKNRQEALDKIQSIRGSHYHLQLKGCLGLATEKTMIPFLKDAIPKDIFIK